jgi:transposase
VILITTDTLFVGIDIGLEKNAAHFLAPNGDSLGRLTFANDLEGVGQLIDRLVQTCSAHNLSVLRIGMEATGLYWWHVHQALSDASEFESYDLQVAVLNPKVVEGFKAVYTDIPKTDLKDAWVIADCLRFGRVHFHPPTDPRYAPLQRLTRLRYQMAHNISREKNRALSLLFLRFSTLAQDAPFSNVFGKASTAVFTEMTVEEIAQTPLEELATRISRHSNNRLGGGNPEAVARELQAAARRAFRLNPKMDSAVGVALAMSVATIRFLEDQLKRLDKAIAQELKGIAQTLDTIPGVGAVYAAGLVAEIGDIHRFPDHDALAKYAGLTWRQHPSGGFAAEDIPLTRSGNFYLRYYLIEAANSVRVRDQEFAAFYERKHRQARHHHHKRALVLTARKLVRLVYALLSEGQIYIPKRGIS